MCNYVHAFVRCCAVFHDIIIVNNLFVDYAHV